MIRTIVIGILAVGGAIAQPPGTEPGGGHFGPGRGPAFEGGARFLGAEPGRPGRVVRNAPYAADVITETTQTLPDGNHIRQTSTVHVARDSEGRTRNEQSLRTLNGLAPNANLPQVVFINDPVAATTYALNPASHTAARSVWEHPAAAQDRPAIRRPERGGGADGGTPGWGRGFGMGATSPNFKTETLGRQTMEGVSAEGTRITLTIPAGRIGNDQPILVVTENWYSAELQILMLSKRTDPRSGETVTRVSSLSRSEPPRALFEVPADFKVTESPNPRPRPSPRPAAGAAK